MLAALFAFPAWVANTLMMVATCFAVSLILTGFLLRSTRGRIFAAGALPPIAIAALPIPSAIQHFPFTDTFFYSYPLMASPYRNFYLLAIAMHFLAMILGYGTMLVAGAIRENPGESSDAP